MPLRLTVIANHLHITTIYDNRSTL